MTSDLQLGITYALLAGVLWGIGPLLLKRGLEYSNVSTATLIEQYFSVACLLILGAYQGELIRPDLPARAFWSFFAAGAVGASFGKIFYYKGIDRVGASKSVTVKNSSPLLTTVLALFFLGEEVTFSIGAGIVLIVVGIAVLTQPAAKGEERPNRLSYFFYPFMAALCFGINPIFKKIGLTAATLPILGTLITQSTALFFMLTLGRFLNIKPKWERVPMKSLLLFSIAGITEALGSLFTFYALVYAPAVLVSPIWRMSPLVTFALAHFTLKGIEVVTFRDGLAASFIVGGIFVLSKG